MNYVSSRNKDLCVSGAQAMAAGIAEDGGLYCPQEIPKLSHEDMQSLLKMDYTQRAATILARFLPEFSVEELLDFAQKAYASEKFGGTDTTPIVKLENGSYILELWKGPTLAFKDMALQMLPHLLTASLKKIGETRTVCILVATSGDTGKAALDGFSDVAGTKIMVYYPNTGVSLVQKLQMCTQKGENVQVCAIDGNFDDAQAAAKRIFTDKAIAKDLNDHNMVLSSANSINWGRLAPQIVYYVSAYLDLLAKGEIKHGEKINVCVPTGNFGNILAAYIAKNMGLPIAKFICASNKNKVLTDFFQTGCYDKRRDFHVTNSPSMDIVVSSNLERLLFYVSGQDHAFVAEMMKNLNENGVYTLPKDLLDKLQSEFYAGYCSEEDTDAEIKTVFEGENYLLDTHTAVATRVLAEYRAKTGDKTKCVVASTASPYKFISSVLSALGQSADGDELALLDKLATISGLPVPTSLSELKTAKVRFDRVFDKNHIEDTIDLLKSL